MKPDDQCRLNGGAYGRVDAPFLWYNSLRRTLESLGFVTCPLDGCLFSLVTRGADGKAQVRGVLGIHVDDGIGGGDAYFSKMIEALRLKYSFGSYDEGEFDFCGVHYKQWDDGSIEVDQRRYIEKIAPLDVPRDRRKTPQSPVSDTERRQLRQLAGSLQYAAVHTRPDLAAKIGIMQAKVPSAVVDDLIEGNRILHEAKCHAVCLMIVPIQESRVTFCCFTDASFASSKVLSARQGTLIFATDLSLGENVKTVICPMAWSSKKIPRVVTSTLSAETVAFSSSLDRLGYIRVLWEWIKDPGVDWSQPDKLLERAPRSHIVTDCKSVFDLTTKVAPPVCTELRTSLECLLIRERMRENMSVRWVSSAAMLADSLTKCMDGQALRASLSAGRYTLFDESEVLKSRASHRERLRWLKGETSSQGTTGNLKV